jgi:effector-binding domain-containing protein
METIELIEKELGDVIEIEEKVPLWKMPSVMKRDFQCILDYVKSKGEDCKEVPYARYLNVDWELEMKKSVLANIVGMFTKKWHFQAGVPVSSNVKGVNHLIGRKIPIQKYIKTIHSGPYQNVGTTYKKMYTWAKSQSLSLMNESIELYLNDPSVTPKDALQTMVLIPVSRK